MVLPIVLAIASTSWAAPPGVEAWDASGAWARLGELRVYQLLGVCAVLGLMLFVGWTLVQSWRDRRHHPPHH